MCNCMVSMANHIAILDNVGVPTKILISQEQLIFQYQTLNKSLAKTLVLGARICKQFNLDNHKYFKMTTLEMKENHRKNRAVPTKLPISHYL